MSDLHRLPLLGHDLPLAADLRRQVRAKARVRKSPAGWSWRHDCGAHEVSEMLLPDQALAVVRAVAHVKRCCS